MGGKIQNDLQTAPHFNPSFFGWAGDAVLHWGENKLSFSILNFFSHNS